MSEAVIVPAGGQGSRMLSVTGGHHKALLPLGDRYVIDHVLDEIAGAGFSSATLVVSDLGSDLANYLRGDRGNSGLQVHLVKQQSRGASGAIIDGVNSAGTESVMVVWCDEVFWGINRVEEVARVNSRMDSCAIALREVPDASRPLCGMASAKSVVGAPDLYRIDSIVEKPSVADWSGNLASIGGYAITREVIDILRALTGRSSVEVPLSAALSVAAGTVPVIGVPIGGEWFDCGNPRGYADAKVRFGGGARCV